MNNRFHAWAFQNFPFMEETFKEIDNYHLMMQILHYLREQLKDYRELVLKVEELENWFKNLDVQEEVNNKLEEMVESGELQEIISKYLNSQAIFSYDSVSDMKSATNLINGSTARTLGYYSANDGGGSLYKIRQRTYDDVVDEKSIILINEDTVAELIVVNNTINAKQFGVKIDGVTDDTDSIQKALDYVSSIGGSLYIPSGVAIISEPLLISSNTKIYGDKGSSIIKAVDEYEEHTFKCLLKNKHSVMDLTETHDESIIIENLKFDNNGSANAGHDGLVQFRGVKNSSIKNIDFNVNGNNCWGIILFSANQNIEIDNVNIDNNSDDESLGGCLWIRSGLTNNSLITRKTLGIHVTNSTFESTASDEVVCVADGVAGGWTEVEIANCTLNGKATTTYSSFILAVYATNNSSFVKLNANNLNLFGKVIQAGIVHGYSGVSASSIQCVYNNININLDSCNYGIRSYYKEQQFNNCNIIVPTNKPSISNGTLLNSYSKGVVSSSYVYNTYIDGSGNNVGADDCKIVENCIIYANMYGIHFYGGLEDVSIQNNRIYANNYAIYSQVANNTGIKRAIISGNILQRKDSTDNTGSVGINAQKTNSMQIINNLTYVTDNYATGNYNGFVYQFNTTDSSNLLSDNNNKFTVS